MPDAIFAEPRLAAIYDVVDGSREDLELYRGVAGEFGARHVLDVGCGTGCLAVLLAADGREVTGVDPAPASLAVARTKPHAELVTWIHGDATTLPIMEADLATMTGNVAQVFLDDSAWSATLTGISGALRPGGHFVFETRRPQRRAWEDWAADTAPRTYDVPGAGRVQIVSLGVEVALPYVTFGDRIRFESDGAVFESSSTLRFRDHDEVADSLTATGFTVLDVRDAPDRPGREYVFVARRD